MGQRRRIDWDRTLAPLPGLIVLMFCLGMLYWNITHG